MGRGGWGGEGGGEVGDVLWVGGTAVGVRVGVQGSWGGDVYEGFGVGFECEAAGFEGGDNGWAGAEGDEDVVGEVGCDEED